VAVSAGRRKPHTFESTALWFELHSAELERVERSGNAMNQILLVENDPDDAEPSAPSASTSHSYQEVLEAGRVLGVYWLQLNQPPGIRE